MEKLCRHFIVSIVHELNQPADKCVWHKRVSNKQKYLFVVEIECASLAKIVTGCMSVR